ncbi:MAG TPA: glycine zipper 2TM domain-containing protein [Burkholderiales bacterium]|jgi:outer membrane lipoprotein SlyB|nr:glycine zipper 2TM domain-containing protein [Burkholderiales bacterium]
MSEQAQTKSRIHPLMATAAVAVIILSAVAVAAITGYLPGSNAQKADEQAAMSQPQANTAKTPQASAAKPAQAAAQPRTQVASAAPAHTAQAKPHCANCGVVQDVKEVELKGEGSGLGAVAGGVVGAVVGNQFGHGTGNTVMTVAGAAGGALAGNEIEKRAKTHKRYDVAVKMADGSMKTVSFEQQPTWRAGDHVKLENGTLAASR